MSIPDESLCPATPAEPAAATPQPFVLPVTIPYATVREGLEANAHVLPKRVVTVVLDAYYGARASMRNASFAHFLTVLAAFPPDLPDKYTWARREWRRAARQEALYVDQQALFFTAGVGAGTIRALQTVFLSGQPLPSSDAKPSTARSQPRRRPGVAPRPVRDVPPPMPYLTGWQASVCHLAAPGGRALCGRKPHYGPRYWMAPPAGLRLCALCVRTQAKRDGSGAPDAA